MFEPSRDRFSVLIFVKLTGRHNRPHHVNPRVLASREKSYFRQPRGNPSCATDPTTVVDEVDTDTQASLASLQPL